MMLCWEDLVAVLQTNGGAATTAATHAACVVVVTAQDTTSELNRRSIVSLLYSNSNAVPLSIYQL